MGGLHWEGAGQCDTREGTCLVQNDLLVGWAVGGARDLNQTNLPLLQVEMLVWVRGEEWGGACVLTSW